MIFSNAMNKITEVDSSCAELINITALILSGNFLEHVHCSCLPPDLEVLELGFNKIYQLEPLCYQRHSKLVYLGLSHNFISDVDHYLQYSVLPNLRHLDLSYNNLNNVEDILNVLSYLPHISILFLNGNPCSLVPGYPDYAISRLPILKQIDGDLISWEGRNTVERFASEGGQFDIKEAVFTVEILRVLNLEPPSQEGEILNNHNNIPSPTKKAAKGISSPKDPNTYYVQIVLFPLEENSGDILGFSLAPAGGSVQSVLPHSPDESIECTPALPWSDCIHFNYGHARHCSNLLQLRDFLKTPMTVRVIRKTEARVEEDESGVSEQVSVVASFLVPLEIFLEKKGEIHYKWENRPEKEKSDRATVVNYNLRDFITKSVSKEKDLGKGSRVKPKVPEKETENRRSVGEDEKPPVDKHLTCHMIVTIKRQNCKGHKVFATARPDMDS